MGLFSKKKEQMTQQPELPPLRFPDLPSEEVPMYGQPQISNSEAQAIKQAMAPMPTPERSYGMPMHEDKPLFVRVEKYKDVMETLNGLKSKLNEAGDILRELSRIKAEEEHELNAWQQDLEQAKERLLAIEKNLSE